MGGATPEEASGAVAAAAEFIRARGLTVGEMVIARRMDFPADLYAQMLARLPDNLARRAAGMLDQAAAAGPPRSHWMLVYHQPAPEGSDEPYLST